MGDALPSSRARLTLLGILSLVVCGIAWLLLSQRSGPGGVAAAKPESFPEAAPTVDLAAGRGITAGRDSAAPSAPTQDGPATAFEGGVVDELQVPVAGVLVTLRPEIGAPIEARSDARGRWAARVVREAPGKLDVTVSARTDDGRAASSTFAWMPSALRAETGVLVLGPASTLVVRATSGGRPVAEAEVYASSVPVWAPPRYESPLTGPWVGWSHRARTDASGEARLDAVPDGDVRVLVLAKGPLRGEARVQAPRKDRAPIAISLSSARDIEVEVVTKASGAPIAGARLLVWGEDSFLVAEPLAMAPTDAKGITWIRGAPIGVAWSLNAIWKGAVEPWGESEETRIPPDATRYRLELSDGTPVRFPIEPGDGPLPLEGDLVSIRDFRFDPFVEAGYIREQARVSDAHVVVARLNNYGWVRAVATLDDGRVGMLESAAPAGKKGSPIPKPVRFVRPRTLTVHVHDALGSPAAGCAVRLFQANGAAWGPSQGVDESGLVTFVGLTPSVFSVRAISCPELVGERRQGVFSGGVDVDLGPGDAKVERVVEPVRDAVVSVTTDGAPGIPALAIVSVGLHPETLDTWARPTGVEVDRDRAEIRFRVRVPVAAGAHRECRVDVRLSAPGTPTRWTPLVLDEASGRLTGHLSIETGGALFMSVRAPADGGAGVDPERLEADGRWVPTWAQPAPLLDDRPDALYEGIPPGRYRLRDSATGCVSETVEVARGTGPAFLFLDLSRSGFAEGTIELPEGIALEGAKVIPQATGIDVEGLERHGPRITVMPPNRFRVRIPGDRPTRLVPSAAGCVPDPGTPELVVESPGTGLRLRLVRK